MSKYFAGLFNIRAREIVDFLAKGYASGKGKLISKCLICVFNFLQKMNENNSHNSKIEFICLFFWR